MKNIAIIGSGDLGQQISYYLSSDKNYNVIGYFDDFLKNEECDDSLKILGNLSEIETLYKEGVFDEIFVGIGYKHMEFRAEIFDNLKNKVKFGTFIHATSFVEKSSKIGRGVVVFPFTILDKNVKIEDNVLINISCTVAHDSTIKQNSFLSPRVAIAGFVSIGKGCNIGINATIIDNIIIDKNIQIGAGSVVIENLKEKGLYVGNPTRFIR